jgi:ribonuclease P protein component
MLPKQHRLSTRYEYNKTRRFGKRIRTPVFDLYYMDVRNYSGPTKIGIVVTNKFEKVAPKRNRIKRVFREVIRKNLDKIKSGYWIVVHPRQYAKGKNYEEISTEFNKILQKVSFSRESGNSDM